jgi:acyl carrier protein
MTSRGDAATRERILAEVVRVLRDVTADWERALGEGLTADTWLVDDLSFESIDVVQLVTALEAHYGRPDLEFQDVLVKDGKYVEDLRIGDLVDFLVAQLGAA